jgi:glycosyltransferase involved in cell wall biosynthesis
MAATETDAQRPTVSVIIPARNEQACLGDCLQSLVTQSGVTFEIIVVDDRSADRTREIAQSFPNQQVRVIEAPPLSPGWTGKNSAVTAGARQARGEWLLFTDADTVHIPGSLARGVAEAQEHNVDLLSYSPEQIAVTFWEMATLPVVFAELARQYPPSVVSDPASSIAAANGQFILIRREAYDAVGGHAAIAGDILEDVALARAVKRAGRKIRFRYAPDAVRTRMYRNYSQLRDGWTKNLALLFPKPGGLAARTLLNWALPWILLFSPLVLLFGADSIRQLAQLTGLRNLLLKLAGVSTHWWWMVIPSLMIGRNLGRLRRANFDLAMEWLGALFGMPMFAYLLLRSKRAHATGNVTWKGRKYLDNPLSEDTCTHKPGSDKTRLLATDN